MNESPIYQDDFNNGKEQETREIKEIKKQLKDIREELENIKNQITQLDARTAGSAILR